MAVHNWIRLESKFWLNGHRITGDEERYSYNFKPPTAQTSKVNTLQLYNRRKSRIVLLTTTLTVKTNVLNSLPCDSLSIQTVKRGGPGKFELLIV